ncbi:MAG: hypothetical protein WAT09_14510 [Paracoccaceae bacterium]
MTSLLSRGPRGARVFGALSGLPLLANLALSGLALAQDGAMPPDWQRHDFRGASFGLPADWNAVQQSDSALAFSAGTAQAQKGPGFGVTLTAMPRSMVKGLEPLGEETIGGWQFTHYRGTETPDGEARIEGDVLISALPVLGNEHIAIVRSTYDDSIAAHQDLFDQIMTSLTLPPADGPWREPVLGGVMQAPLPDAWKDYRPDDNATARFTRIDPRGAVTLIRYDAADQDWSSWTYRVEERTPGQPVTFLGQPARLYDWAKPQDSYGDESDDLEGVRLYVMETCLPGGAPVAVLVEGMAAFQTSGTVQNLLDGLLYTPGPGALPCADAVFPVPETSAEAAVRRVDTGDSLLVRPVPQPDWAAQTLGALSFAVPTHWTGGPVDGGLAFMSSQGEYELYFGTTPDAPIQTDRQPEAVIDGQRFVVVHQADGEVLISMAPIATQGHLVVTLRGGMAKGPGFIDILATMKLDVPQVQPVTAQGLGGLVDYTVPVGWTVAETPDSVTLMADDARGYFTILRGAALLAPDGMAGLVRLRSHGDFESLAGLELSGYAWEGTVPEFIDKGVRDPGYHRLWISRTCLPGGEAFAVAFGGVQRFREGKTLARLKSDLAFHLPEGTAECDGPRSAGLILDPETDMVTGPMVDPAAMPPAPTVAEDAPVQPAPVTAPEPEPAAEPAPQVAPPPPPVLAAPPPSPPPPPMAEPDVFLAEEGGYSRYTNGRYGTAISYPSSYFTAQPPPGNGDGRTFVSADGSAQFMVFAQYDAMELGQAGLQQFDRDMAGTDQITHSAEGLGWYEMAGLSEGSAFYRKVLVSQDGFVQVFEISYPQAQIAEFEPVIRYMADGFGPLVDVPMDGVAEGGENQMFEAVSYPAVNIGALFTPARGTDLRKVLADTARVPVEGLLQQPVIFVISVLNTDGTWAYLQGTPVRPNGKPINWKATPYANDIAQGVMSDTVMSLMLNVDGEWVMMMEAFGPTDVAWVDWLDLYGLPEALFTP